jgi:hypothetical protein
MSNIRNISAIQRLHIGVEQRRRRYLWFQSIQTKRTKIQSILEIAEGQTFFQHKTESFANSSLTNDGQSLAGNDIRFLRIGGIVVANTP